MPRRASVGCGIGATGGVVERAAISHELMSERSMFDATAHEVKMLMMHTRATFYATQPINAAAYVPVEACGAHEWSYIRRHGCAALAADVAAKPAAALTTAGSAATKPTAAAEPPPPPSPPPPISRISHKS
jgi:hypothetical protein